MADSTRQSTTGEIPDLTFGIFPGISGTEDGTPAHTLDSYDPKLTDKALSRLQSQGCPFLVRAYTVYKGAERVENETPPNVIPFIHSGRQLDYVLCYRSAHGNVEDWTEFVRQTVRELGTHITFLQITEEPNNPDASTGGDGGSPNIRQAIIDGVLAAKDEATKLRLPISVGFNAAISFNPNDDFWPEIAARGSKQFADALDYVGLDFFPDVFRPLPTDDLTGAVRGVLSHFRSVNMVTGNIPSTIPVHITENGWPTTPNRSVERQAVVIETVVRAVNDVQKELNITHYELFALRDAEPGNPEKLCQFGLLRTDYTPKPAFDTYRRLIKELGIRQAD